LRKNYHTHTHRCFHAQGADADFAAAAKEQGFSVIGFSDHGPWPFKDYVSGMRMPAAALEDYAESVFSLRAQYRGEMEILLGLESEYFPQYLPWLCAMAEKHGLDYLILGHHFSGNEPGGIYNGSLTHARDVVRYQKDVCAAMKTGLFSYVCHPDLFMRGYPVFDKTCEKASRAIIETAMETNTPLEYNLLGLQHSLHDGKQGYPYPAFWQLAAEYRATAIIGIDAHTPDAYRDTQTIAAAEQYLADLGIPVTDEIRLLHD
jgi:histidinol-phosphatase (PHP family)